MNFGFKRLQVLAVYPVDVTNNHRAAFGAEFTRGQKIDPHLTIHCSAV